MSLSELKPGNRAIIKAFARQEGSDDLTLRLMEMGLTIGSEIEIAYEAPFGGTIAVRSRGGLIAVRTSDAKLIEVESRLAPKPQDQMRATEK